MAFMLCGVLSAEETATNKWLDEYPKHIGFSWNAEAHVVGNYIWRGLYVGGLSLQPEAKVGYGGAFFDVWGSVGASNWVFNGLTPELDVSVGYERWGLKLMVMHMFYFDKWENYTSEVRLGYKVSSKLPLSILICSRFWGRDSYVAEDGTLHRAFSTYIQLGYDFSLPWELMLEARLGMTPSKSLYTSYKGDFAVVNIEFVLRRQWKLTDYCSLQTHAQLMLNPWRVDKYNVQWDAKNPSEQKLNFSLGVGVIFN